MRRVPPTARRSDGARDRLRGTFLARRLRSGVQRPEGTRRDGSGVDGRAVRAARRLVKAGLGQVMRSGATRVRDWRSREQDPPSVGSPAAGYDREILGDQPASYWTLEEASGPFADQGSAQQAGTAANTDSMTRAVAGLIADGATALQLRAGARVDAASTTHDFVGRAPFSFEFIFRADIVDSGYRRLYDKTDGYGVSREGIAIWVQDAGQGGRLALDRYAANTYGGVSSPPGSIVAGTTYHAVIVYDGAAFDLYLDGVPVISAGGSGATNDLAGNSAVLTLGELPGSSSDAGGWDGVLQKVAVYDYALSPAKVAAHSAAAEHTSPLHQAAASRRGSV